MRVAVRLRAWQHARRRTEREQNRVGLKLVVVGRDARWRHEPPGAVDDVNVVPRHPQRDVVRLLENELADALVDRGHVDARAKSVGGAVGVRDAKLRGTARDGEPFCGGDDGL